MTDLFAQLALGFSTALTPLNLLLCFVGVLVGTLIGVLPGLGPIATIAMLLPITFHLEPVGALIMLAGIYYGAQYGGSTTAILVNMPGEVTSVVTTLDGHQMAKQGRAGAALATAALASFAAGTFATLVIAVLGLPLTKLAQAFGPPEYCMLMLFGLAACVVIAAGDPLKAIVMVLLGLLLGIVGADLETGAVRLTFGVSELFEGLDFVTLAVGLYGVAEILKNLENPEERVKVTDKITHLWPSKDDFKRAAPATVRGTLIGSILGILPGNGAVMAPFASYVLEKTLSKKPQEFGHGAVEGVAGPESANNAGSQTSFIPLLTLGIPPNAVMAMMVGAMTLHGIVPGPQVMTKNPDLFWGMIASMWIGNLFLVIINLPLIRIWVKLLQIPYKLLYPAILMFCAIGIYSLRGSPFDVVMTALFGVVGLLFIKFGFERTPLLVAFVLGKLFEEKLRQSLLISQGDLSIFVSRPISLGILVVTVLLCTVLLFPSVRKSRNTVFKDD